VLRYAAVVVAIALLSEMRPFGCASAAEPPKLIVMLSIDQFPYEYLQRMRPGFSPSGAFLRLCDDGANFTNCHHGHALTKTGPGHSVFLSGTFPDRNGIIDNDWFDPEAKGSKPGRMYCVDDPDVQIVGAAGKDGGKSPKNLLVSTLGDVLKLARPESRVFAIALKDRAGILMAGHAADGVYWLDGGQWVTSTYYRNDLPGYLRSMNESRAGEQYAGQTWSLLHPADRYTLYYPDDAKFEGSLPGSGRAFPHTMPAASEKLYFTAMTTSPFGNDYTLAAARVLVESEQLGRRGATDILAVNLSSNDYVGHMFGPHSLEVQDITYRTDLQLGEFAAFIERHLNGAPWVMALSSDHGVAPIPEFAAERKLPAGRDQVKLKELEQKIEAALVAEFGELDEKQKYIREFDDGNVYLNRQLDEHTEGAHFAWQCAVRDLLLREPLIAAAFTRDELEQRLATAGLARQFQRTFHARRSGDVLFCLAPYQILGKTPATHGSPWQYDSHVPLLLWGYGIRRGRYSTEATPAAIAPTLAKLLGIDPPAACAVESLDEALLPAPAGRSPEVTPPPRL
jgi:predicted AlkP superfamily pyrophosphatase or phosphodiesterase